MLQTPNVAEEVNAAMTVAEGAETKVLENFNAALEARRKTFVKTLRKNAFKNVRRGGGRWHTII